MFNYKLKGGKLVRSFIPGRGEEMQQVRINLPNLNKEFGVKSDMSDKEIQDLASKIAAEVKIEIKKYLQSLSVSGNIQNMIKDGIEVPKTDDTIMVLGAKSKVSFIGVEVEKESTDDAIEEQKEKLRRFKKGK